MSRVPLRKKHFASEATYLQITPLGMQQKVLI